MIYGKKKAEMYQLANNKIQARMEGGERIYSQADTQKIISMAMSAKTNKDLVALGRYVYNSTKKQDSNPVQYAD